MSAFSNFLENKVLDHIFRSGTFTKPSTLYIGLMTAAADGEAGSITEVSGGAYARVADNPSDTNWSAATAGNGTTDNLTTISFPTATADWGTVTHFGVFDAATAGNLLIYAALGASRNITTGATPSFAPGALTVQVDN